jgi:hypothetical protein
MDFMMNFENNQYNGEKQIRETLKQKQKFTEDVESETFKKKCEQRLFTQKVMPWSEVKKRSAMNPKWPWHHPAALDKLKEKLVYEDQWREDGNYIEKPPFPKPQTSVMIQLLNRNDDTGEAVLRLTPVYGDILLYEYGKEVSKGSMKVEEPKNFRTRELVVSFLCLDSKGQHEVGNPVVWENAINVKSRIFSQNNQKMVELVSAPEAPIRYTTDGSSPKTHGGSYNGPFPLPENTSLLLAVAEKNGIVSEIHKLDISGEEKAFEIDPEKPLTWMREHNPATTRESYELMRLIKKYHAKVYGVRATVSGANYVEMAFDPNFRVSGDNLEGSVEHLRSLLEEGQVSIRVEKTVFEKGQFFMDWIAEIKSEVKPDEVVQ